MTVLFEGIIVPGIVAFLALAFKLCGKENGEPFDLRNDLFVAWEILMSAIGVGGTAWVAGQFGNPKNLELASRGFRTALFISLISFVIGLYLRFGGFESSNEASHESREHRLKVGAFWTLNILSFGLLLIAVTYIYLSIEITVRM